MSRLAGLAQLFDAVDISRKEIAWTIKKVVDNLAAFLYFDRVKSVKSYADVCNLRKEDDHGFV